VDLGSKNKPLICFAGISGREQTANRSEDCSGHRTGSNQFWFVDSGCSRHMTGKNLISSHLLLLKEGVWGLVMKN